MFCYIIYEQLFRKRIGYDMTKYRIVNKFRFITFLTVLILILSFAAISIFDLSKVSGSDIREYSEITVVDGDTIWQIAKTYGSDSKDIREVVYEICKINNINADMLRAGQKLLVPVK